MSCLPTGYPHGLNGPMAWNGATFDNKPHLYTEVLTEADIEEIRDAISYFKKLDVARGHICRDNFPLSAGLSTKLRNVNETLNNGKGFQVIRGIKPSSFSEEEHILLFAGIAAHVASNRAAFIDHIRSEEADEQANTNLRPTELSVSMDFHTDADAGAILALFTENMAKRGGEQYLASFWEVYNTLARENPEVLCSLVADWHWEKPDYNNDSLANQVLPRRAIVGQTDGKLEINYGRSFVAGHAKYPLTKDAPPLTESQERALQILNDLAQKNSFKLDTQVGDILFVNNLSIMHARGAFEDDLQLGATRHVLRLWLTDENSWPFASSLKYHNSADFWDTLPEHQNLRTLSEWRNTPRAVRVTEAGTSCSHD